MKVVAFNGSPRKDGNTFRLVQYVFKSLQAEGIETELVQLGGNLIHGCTACYQCFKNKDGRCVLADDMVNDCIARMRQADGIILASPTYFADITPELKALIDRAGFVAGANDNFLKRKVGAAVIAERFKAVSDAGARKNESVEAGRAFVEAYVSYTHYLEVVHTAIAASGHKHGG